MRFWFTYLLVYVLKQIAFKHGFLTVMQAINTGSLAWTSSTLTLNVFTESDCKGNSLGKTLVYSQDVAFGGHGNIHDVEKFKSIWLSRSLQDQEQLDISRSGQNNGQSQVYFCGEYIMNLRVGIQAGCQNIPNGGTAECVRLWHY